MGLLATQLLRGHTVWSRFGRESVVMDCGANRGEFATIMSRQFGCRVISLEPNPTLFAGLPKVAGVTYLPYALGGRDGTTTFQIGDNPESSSLVATPDGHHSSVDVQLRTLETVMREAGVSRVNLIKMDIEGAEIEALGSASDETLKAVDQFTIEFHDFIGYVTVEQIEKSLARLRALGFRVCIMTKFGHGDVMAVQERTTGFSDRTARRVMKIDKNPRGVGRMISRIFKPTEPLRKKAQ